MATRDRDLLSLPGLAAAAIWLLLAVAAVVLFLVSVTGGDAASWGGVAGAALLGLLLLIGLNGFVVVQPNQAKVGTIREGAVGMVDHALRSLNDRDIVDLDEERKAAMVSNLMVVLVSDRAGRLPGPEGGGPGRASGPSARPRRP